MCSCQGPVETVCWSCFTLRQDVRLDFLTSDEFCDGSGAGSVTNCLITSQPVLDFVTDPGRDPSQIDTLDDFVTDLDWIRHKMLLWTIL